MSKHIETMKAGYVKLTEAKTLFATAQEEAFTAKDAKAVTTSTRALGYTTQAVKASQSVISRKEDTTAPKKVWA